MDKSTEHRMISTRQYNEAREELKKLGSEQRRLEAAEDFDHDERLVEIQDRRFFLESNVISAYKAQSRAVSDATFRAALGPCGK